MQTILHKPTHTSEAVSNVENSAKKKFFKFNIFNWAANILLVLVFVLPFFFLPVTADAFDLNKSYLVMFVSVLALLLYFIGAAQKGKLSFWEIKAYLPLIFILTAGILGVVFSMNKHLSLYGFYQNYSSSFMYLVGLVILGYVATGVDVKFERLLKWFSIGVALTTLLAILTYFGVPIPGLGQVFRQFSFAGATTILLGIQVIAFLSVLYLMPKALESKDIKWIVVYAIVAVLGATYLLYALNPAALLIAFAGLVYLAITGKLLVTKHAGYYFGLFASIALLVFLAYFPVTRAALGLESFINPLRLAILESWYVSAMTIRDLPLKGSGLSTHFMNFSRYRPETLNYTDAWQVRFHHPYNDIFSWLATTGLVGFVLYIAFWIVSAANTLKLRKQNSEKGDLYLFIFTILLALLLLLGFNPILLVLLFLVVGAVAYNGHYKEKTIKGGAFPAFLTLLPIILFALLVYKSYFVYSGQYNFWKASRTNAAVERYNLQKRALQFDPFEGLYRREAVATGLFIANGIATAENVSEEDAQVVQSLIQESVLDARRLTELVNPIDVSNWELRGNVYNFLTGVDENAVPFSIQAYTNAINIEPSNPVLWLNLGAIYYRQGLYQNAIQAFNRSVQLKSDYANAHYNLAYALKDAGDINNAVVQLEITARLLPEGSEDVTRVETELEAFRVIQVEQEEEAARIRALQVEQQNPEDVIQSDSQDPLQRPEEVNNRRLEVEGEITIPEEVLDPELEGPGINNSDSEVSEDAGANDEIPVADGTEVDADQGETEAPLAQPAGEE